MISSFPSSGDAASVVLRHDPGAHPRPIERREAAELPFDPSALPAGLPVMLDTGFYIDRLKGKLAPDILDFVERRQILHSGVACGELAVATGMLTPGHPTTPGFRGPIMNLLATIDLAEAVSPSTAAWAEAGVVAGILARTQHLNRSRKELSPDQACCQEGKRRKLLNDALIFLSAAEAGAVLVSGNVRDVDLLLRFKPGADVLLYKRE